jgi:DNA-binding response OmpR family regulator
MNTILIIEDEKLLADALKRKLERSGFSVFIAIDGAEGLEFALDKHPDLILLDIVMPIMDGITVLDRIREDEWGAKVPVLILSNLSDAESIKESKASGINDYLIKTDWKISDVVKKVKENLKNR